MYQPRLAAGPTPQDGMSVKLLEESNQDAFQRLLNDISSDYINNTDDNSLVSISEYGQGGNQNLTLTEGDRKCISGKH